MDNLVLWVWCLPNGVDDHLAAGWKLCCTGRKNPLFALMVNPAGGKDKWDHSGPNAQITMFNSDIHFLKAVLVA
jgi:hypothetical protein